MILITDIRPYKRTKLFEVSSEVGIEFLASEKFLTLHDITIGAQFDEEDFEVIRAKAQVTDGIRKAIDILSRKDYSKKELLKKLCDKGVPEDAAQASVDYVAGKGYQDDFRYAKRLAEVGKGSYGKRRVEQMLYHHGIQRDTIRDVLDEVFSDESEEEPKLDETLIKIMKGQPLTDPAEKNRVYAKLARKGYESAAIQGAISRYEANRKDESL